MSKLDRAVETIAGRTKRVLAEVIGDGRLNEDGTRQERQAERRAEAERNAGKDAQTNVSKITNNLT